MTFAWNLPLWRERRKTQYPCDSANSLAANQPPAMTDIDVLLTETRKFQPPPDFARASNVSSPGIYDGADGDYEKFWADQARELEWI